MYIEYKIEYKIENNGKQNFLSLPIISVYQLEEFVMAQKIVKMEVTKSPIQKLQIAVSY